MDKKKLGKILIILLLTIQPFIIGAKFFDLELRNVNQQPLVDMKKLVNGDSIIAKALEKSDEEGKSKEKQPETVIVDKKKDNITIRITGDVIYIDEKARSLASFEAAFDKAYKNGMSVTVIDDYADYKVMHGVVGCLDGKGIMFQTKEAG